MKKACYTLLAVSTFAVGVVVGIRFNIQQTKVECKPWFPISQEAKRKVLYRYVTITSGKKVGSGCLIKPGYYLTALHVLGEGILNDSPIAVDDMKAQIVAHSSTDDDIAIVSTYAEIDKKDAELETYNAFEDNQDIIIVGNPGTIGPFVQPAKILRDVYDEQRQKKPGAKMISAQYIEAGISGGCVYSADGNTLLGIVTKKYDSSSIGEITPVSRSLK